MFSLEVILGEFRGLSFIYVAIASVVSALVSRALTGDDTIFAIEKLRAVLSMASPWEILTFIGLGAFIASISKTFNFILESFEDFYEKLKFPEYLMPATGGLAIGLLAYYATRIIPVRELSNPLSVLGVGYYTIRQVLNPENYINWIGLNGIWMLVLALAMLAVYKIIATSLPSVPEDRVESLPHLSLSEPWPEDYTELYFIISSLDIPLHPPSTHW